MQSERRAAWEPAEVEITDGTAVVRVRGELDLSIAPVLSEQLAEVAAKKPDRLIIDLAAATYLDCATARVIFGAARSMLPDGNPVVLRSPRPLVRRLLELTGLDGQCQLDANGSFPRPAG